MFTFIRRTQTLSVRKQASKGVGVLPAGSACRCEHFSPQIKSLYKLFGGGSLREFTIGTTAKATHPGTLAASRSSLASAHTPSGSNRATACTRSTSARCLRFAACVSPGHGNLLAPRFVLFAAAFANLPCVSPSIAHLPRLPSHLLFLLYRSFMPK